MTDKTDLHGNCIMGDECGNLDALRRDHYQARPVEDPELCYHTDVARPTFEGDEADTSELLTIAWLDGASRDRTERDEALAAKERAEQALAERDAAIVAWLRCQADLRQNERDGLPVQSGHMFDEITTRVAIIRKMADAIERGEPFLAAPEPVDPLVDVYEQIRENIRGFSAAEFANDLRAALAARGGKVVFGEVDHD